VSVPGDSVAILTKRERVPSDWEFRSRVLIDFIREKLLSTAAVETGR